MIFSPEYINYLFATYDELFKSKDELYEMIFSNYLSEESFGKRPLSKLTHDVCDDLYDIYYGLKLEQKKIRKLLQLSKSKNKLESRMFLSSSKHMDYECIKQYVYKACRYVAAT